MVNRTVGSSDLERQSSQKVGGEHGRLRFDVYASPRYSCGHVIKMGQPSPRQRWTYAKRERTVRYVLCWYSAVMVMKTLQTDDQARVARKTELSRGGKL
ncbi:hypothetical protein GN244_ATG07851 [Phytophthora infestans]|uniref:Uncharacterized protein n=1 Tax=Phytophthora infestans TaxID=4787 RepID=A0A833WWA3_PHYIN|nr:hypothetical protein GN244_ATG07851 [Phytophthora infestans]KAF4150270.1 hypothetical protein GN958_ATG00478 [Phytophthora infestans]